MDISVKHLNDRMALQVPPELPLGLVFIVGQVKNLHVPEQGVESATFDLTEVDYRLQCRLPVHVAKETLLQDGDRIRVGGHLSFDSRRVRYYLLARDLEVLPRRPPSTLEKMAPSAVEANDEQSVLAPAELPTWVLELAPPELRAELGLEPPAEPEPEAEAALPQREPEAEQNTATLASVSSLPPEMVRFLSSAIDDDEEIELTSAMIARYLPADPPPSRAATKGAAVVADRPVAARDAVALTAPDEPAAEKLTLTQVLILLIVVLLIVIIAAQLFLLFVPR